MPLDARMSAVVPLHHMASAVVIRTLLDHNDQHSRECRTNAQNLITQLETNLYTAVSKDLLELFVNSYRRQLPAFLLPVLAPPHLRVLSLKRCCVIEEDSKMEFKYFKETLRRCSKLQALELDGCNLALPLQLCDIIILHAPQLLSVSVEECRGISNEFVQKLLKGLPELRHLNLSICPEVTDSVFALSETQGLLEERDRTRDSTSGGCNLNSVDLSGNPQLTSTCIRHLTELCGPRLRHLNVAATRMDCTILWFLSGYSLSTAVQLAAEANKSIMGNDSSDGETLAQLITEFRVLQEKLKHLQEEECQKQEEGGREGVEEVASRAGGDDAESLPVDAQAQEDIKEAAGGCRVVATEEKQEMNRRDEDRVSDQDANYLPAVGHHKEDETLKDEDEQETESVSRLEADSASGQEEMPRMKTKLVEQANCGNPPEKHQKKDESTTVGLQEAMGDANGSQEDARRERQSPMEHERPTNEEQSDELDLALDHFVIDILEKCTDRLVCERQPCVCNCAHSQNLGAESAGHSCQSVRPKASSTVCKSVQTDPASDIVSLQRTPPANERSDGNESVEYSCNSGSLSNQTRHASSSTDASESGRTSSTNDRSQESLHSASSSNQTQDNKTASICPWRRLYTPCITSLDMSIIDFDATLVVTCLKEFFLANKQLRKLTVCWKELTDSMLDIIAAGGTELQSLCLVDCSSLTSIGVAHLLSNCKNLQDLDLQGVCYLSDMAVMPIFLQGDSCKLHSLKLSETNISDATLIKIAKYLGKKVTTLEISWCEEISNKGLAEIATHCTALKTLTLRQCSMDTDSLMDLAWNCTGLSSLNMSGVENLTDGVAQAMMPSLRHLTKLDISWNSDLTDAAVSSVLSCCPLMVELYLMGLKRITEKPFMPIISELARWQRCKKLIKLKMKERTLLRRLGEEQFSSDEEYEDLFSPLRSTAYAPCLRTLDLQYCDRVNDELLAELVAICVGTMSITDYYGVEVKPKLMK